MAARCTGALKDDVIPELARLCHTLDTALAGGQPGIVRPAVRDGVEIISGEIEGLRELIHELHPVALDRDGLAAALEALLSHTANREGLLARLHVVPEGATPSLTRSEALAVYRILEETMRNVVDHAQATSVTVVVRARPRVSVRVRDDGCGFNPSAARGGFGLATMRERAQLIGAVIHLDSTIGDGTEVLVELNESPSDEAVRSPSVHENHYAQIATRLDHLRRGVEAQEAECARWARELHDEALQRLGAALSYAWTAAQEPNDGASLDAAKRMRAELEATLSGLAELIDDLCQPPPVRLGLLASLEALTNRNADDRLSVVLESPPAGLQAVAADTAVAIYRIVQEALTNAVKHSHASRVVVSLRQTGGEVIVSIRDDGTGFHPASIRRGLGLRSMTERASLVRGTLEVVSRTGGGTTVHLRLPAAP